MGDTSTAGMIPNWKIVEQQLGARMGGKQTREKVTSNSEHKQLAVTKNVLAA
jgi:hypothetical protein